MRQVAEKGRRAAPKKVKRRAVPPKGDSAKKTDPRPKRTTKAPRARATAKTTSDQRAGTARAAGPKPRLRRANAADVVERLALAIPTPHVELSHRNPWELLVAVILSAQSTDRRVNLVTPELFRRWPTPPALAAAPVPEVEEVVRSTGFFRNKTKAIRGASQMLVERFGGEVPRSMEDLLQVPGVARKTANVVLGAAHAVSAGIVTDTHAMRVAQRLGLTRQTAPEKIEADLCREFPQETWIEMGHRLVLHGRYVCTARAPKCPGCPLNEICPSRLAPGLGDWQQRARDESDEMTERAHEFRRA